MKRTIYRYIACIIAAFSIGACDEFLDVNQNPNNPSSAQIDLLFPNAIVEAGFWTSRTQNENAAIFSRQFYDLNESTYNIQGNLTDTEFNQIYADPLKDFAQIITDSESKGLDGYAGTSKVMTAYLFSMLVDLWGDVPYFQALQGETILNAEFDLGQEIYDDLLLKLDEAIDDLELARDEEEVIAGDLIYGGNFTNWIRAAYSLKLKLLLNLRMTDAARATSEIAAIVAKDSLINTVAQEFDFQFGENISPINQHPIYQQEYVAGTKVFYMSNYLMYNMLAKEDPRLRYYIYRQGSNEELDFQTTPCAQRTDCIYWPLLANEPAADGYIGREHGDPSGLPGDNTIRATFGVYPIGGSYDDDARAERLVTSATGQGLSIWISASMVKFMLAEAALTLGTPGDPKALMTEGIQLSMDKVTAFGAALDEDAPAPNDPDLLASVESYIAGREADYDNASSDAQRLDVVIKEKYYAQFGNGLETYNDLRRTGFPSDLPDALAPSGPFPVRFPLGPTELNSNPFAPNPAPLVTQPVFWDNN